MFDRLVVGFDGSQPSVPLRWAADEAHLRRARSTRSRASSCRCCSPSGRRARFLCSHLRSNRCAPTPRPISAVSSLTSPEAIPRWRSNRTSWTGTHSTFSATSPNGPTWWSSARQGARFVEAPPLGSTALGLVRTCASPLVLVPGTDRHHKTDRIVVGTTDPSIRTTRSTGPSTKPTAAAQTSSSSMPGRIPTARRSSRRPRCMTAPESTRASRSAQQSNAARKESG